MNKPETNINHESQASIWRREEMLHLLSLSPTLAGLCITGVTLFQTMNVSTLRGTIADDTLAASALLFLLCTYIIFITLRVQRSKWAMRLEKLVDILFLLALTGMVSSGFIMMYTLL